MGTDNRAVNHSLFHIRVVGKVRQHSFPNTLVAPAPKALVDHVPFAILSRQESPRSTAAGQPQDALDESATFFLLPTNVGVLILAQEFRYLRPLGIIQSRACHPISLSLLIKCQHYLALHGHNEGITGPLWRAWGRMTAIVTQRTDVCQGQKVTFITCGLTAPYYRLRY